MPLPAPRWSARIAHRRHRFRRAAALLAWTTDPAGAHARPRRSRPGRAPAREETWGGCGDRPSSLGSAPRLGEIPSHFQASPSEIGTGRRRGTHGRLHVSHRARVPFVPLTRRLTYI